MKLEIMDLEVEEVYQSILIACKSTLFLFTKIHFKEKQ